MNKFNKYIKNEMDMYCFLKNPKPKTPCLPSNIIIEPTNACNLNCAFCVREKTQRKIGTMSLDNFKNIIDKLVEEDFHVPISITGNGEPTMNKSIFSMIKYAKKKQFTVSMITNSTLLNDSKIDELVSSGLDRYQTMFDSIDKESYENIRVNSNYEKTKNNLIKFINKNEEMGHPIFISLGSVKTSLTKKICETKSFWESFPIDNYFVSPLLSIQASSKLYEESIKDIDKPYYKPCEAPWTNLFISNNGDVKLCPLDFNNTYVLGNIFETSIKSLWNGEKAQKLRKALLENDLEYFSNIGHNCEECNSPYIMYSIEEYRESIPSRMVRNAKFHNK